MSPNMSNEMPSTMNHLRSRPAAVKKIKKYCRNIVFRNVPRSAIFRNVPQCSAMLADFFYGFRDLRTKKMLAQFTPPASTLETENFCI